MKKIYFLWACAICLIAFPACDDDRDANPVLSEPAHFVLDVPANAATKVYDLEHITSLELSCTQPDYGFTAGMSYLVQLSLNETFTDENKETGVKANYSTLATLHNTPVMEVNKNELVYAFLDLWRQAHGTDPVPAEAVPVYIRLKSEITGSGRGIAWSNTIELRVLGYEPPATVKLPAELYFNGSWKAANWSKWMPMVPVNGYDGKFWLMVYLGSGENEFKFSTIADWGPAIAYDNPNLVISDEAKATAQVVAGSGDANQNILVKNAGWYILAITSEIAGNAVQYTLDLYPPKIYLIGDVTTVGWSRDDTKPFTVPAGGEGEFVSPAFDKGGDVRMFAYLPDIADGDWWRTEFMVFDSRIVYRGNGSDQERVSAGAGQKAYLDFAKGTGAFR